MSGIRAQQKEKTRRLLIDAALNQLSAERSFSSLSLREVAKEAGLAPTSFYRHFSDMDELGLTLVDEAGLTLRQLRTWHKTSMLKLHRRLSLMHEHTSKYIKKRARLLAIW